MPSIAICDENSMDSEISTIAFRGLWDSIIMSSENDTDSEILIYLKPNPTSVSSVK